MANRITFITENNQTKATFDYDNLTDITNSSTLTQAAGAGTEVEANPEGTATEDLTKIGIDDSIYGIPQGTPVVANPTLAGTEADLTGLEVAGTKYKVPQGGGTSQLYLHTIRIASPASGGTTGMKYQIILFVINNSSSNFTSVTALFDYFDNLTVGTSTIICPMFQGYCVNLANTTSDSTRPIQQLYYDKTHGYMPIYYRSDTGSDLNFLLSRTSSDVFFYDYISKLF